MDSRFYRFPDLEQRVRLSMTTIWRLEKAGRFPARRRLSVNSVAWVQAEVDQWIDSRERAAGSVDGGGKYVQ